MACGIEEFGTVVLKKDTESAHHLEIFRSTPFCIEIVIYLSIAVLVFCIDGGVPDGVGNDISLIGRVISHRVRLDDIAIIVVRTEIRIHAGVL